MPIAKMIMIVCDQWNSPRPIRLTPSMTAVQILRQIGLGPSGALIHQRSTIDPASGLTVRETWMGRNKPCKQVIAGDVVQAVQLIQSEAKKAADQTEPVFDTGRPSKSA